MIIALDYDGTASTDMVMWLQFVQLAQQRGHEVHVVTMRYPHEHCEDLALLETATGNPICYTGREAKRKFVAKRDIDVAIWIDDNPHWILVDAAA
jgi:hypothetical protein